MSLTTEQNIDLLAENTQYPVQAKTRIILRAARNDSFEKSRFLMEMESPTVDLPSTVEFDFR